MTLLGYERGEAAATFPLMFRIELDRLVALAKERGATDDPVIRQRLARCHTKVEIMRYLGLRSLTQFLHGHQPGSGVGASSRTSGASTTRRSPQLAVDILGADAMAPSRPLAHLVVPDRLAGRAERQRQLGRHVVQRPRRHDLRRVEPDPAQHRRRDGARPPEGATRRRPRTWRDQQAARSLTIGWALAAVRAVLPHPSLWRTGLRQVRRLARRAGGGGRRSSRCRRPTTSGSGWRPPTAAPATSAPGATTS